MKKGVALPYLVGLLLGIIVLASIVYLSYRHITGEPLPCSECEAWFLGWCTKCRLINPGTDIWKGVNTMSDELKECASKCGLISQDTCVGAESACNTTGVF